MFIRLLSKTITTYYQMERERWRPNRLRLGRDEEGAAGVDPNHQLPKHAKLNFLNKEIESLPDFLIF